MPATPTQTLLDDSSCFACLGMSVGDALLLAQVAQMHANLVARLNAGAETPAQIVSDTAA